MTDDTMRRRRELAARALIKRRKELDLTQEQLAQRAGVVVRTIHNIENGRWPNTRSRTLIEEAVGWPPGEFERLASPPPPSIDPNLVDAALRLTIEQLDELVDFVKQRHSKGRDDPGDGLRIVNGNDA